MEKHDALGFAIVMLLVGIAMGIGFMWLLIR